MSEWRIEHLDAWSADGPGWSNCGITAHMKGPCVEVEKGILKEKEKVITVYPEDLTAEESLALSVALCVKRVLEDAIMRAHKKGASR